MIKKLDKGYSFQYFNRIGGYLTQLFALYLFISDIYDSFNGYYWNWFRFFIAIALMLVGVTFSYAREYLLINYDNGNIKNILNILGKEFTTENNLTKYKHTSIISRRFNYDGLDDDNSSSFYADKKEYTLKYDVVLLTPKHLGRFLISQFDEFDEAKELAEQVSKYTGKPLVKYNPKRISKKR